MRIVFELAKMVGASLLVKIVFSMLYCIANILGLWIFMNLLDPRTSSVLITMIWLSMTAIFAPLWASSGLIGRDILHSFFEENNSAWPVLDTRRATLSSQRNSEVLYGTKLPSTQVTRPFLLGMYPRAHSSLHSRAEKTRVTNRKTGNLEPTDWAKLNFNLNQGRLAKSNYETHPF